MPRVKKIYMPEMTLELDPDLVIMSHVTDALHRASLDPTAMLYCGVDASKFEHARNLPPRPATFATSYDDMLQYADQYDKSYAFINTHALAYVRMASREIDAVPALITYDETQLHTEDQLLFVPKVGDNVQKAARAVLFFS